ncbi:hypothetical protein AGMMS50225_01150 [Betaproteobacteria bacterium]|nr:hypothetical protein AGMMS50225_01150 [Betaproteobacteria bacterium]
MKTKAKLRLADVFVSITDPRQSGSYLGEDDITRLDDVYDRTGEVVAQK